MMGSSRQPYGQSNIVNIYQWLRDNAVLLTFLAGQLGAALWWARGIDIRVDALERTQHDQDSVMARLDERGSRSIPSMETRLAQHEALFVQEQRQLDELHARANTVLPVVQVQLDNLKEQQTRIIQALDSTYNLLNEHMRNDGIKNPNLNLTKPKQ